MKISTAALTVSLVANAALLAVLALSPAGPGSDSHSLNAAGASAATTAGATGGSRGAGKKSPAPAATRKTWDRLRTDDLAALVDRLRAAGFPPNVIRNIVGTLVRERFDARRLEIQKSNLEAPFWTSTTNPNSDPKIGPELRNLQREQTELIKQLLGGSLADLFAGTDEDRAMLRYQIGNIAPEKLEQLYNAAMNYGEKITAVYAATSTGGGRSVLLDSDREKVVALDKAYRDELAKFLTPSEVTDFIMHNGPTAGQLRNALGPFRPSEDEYRAIFPIYQSFVDQNPTVNPTQPGPDATPAARAAVSQLYSQLGAALGPDRAADLQQVANPANNQINRLVARLDLPLSAAADVVAVQQDIQQRATALRSDDTLTGDARRAQISALAQEASAKISTALGGQRGLDAYKENGGQWLTNLQPRPPAPAPKG
jgi:hypothetical protein